MLNFSVNRKLRQLRSDRAEVRANAICALAECGDASAVEPLCHVLRTDERALRLAAAQALAAIGDSSAVQPMIEALRAEHSWDVRHEIVEALRKIGDPRAVNELVLLIESDQDLSARELAASVVKDLGAGQLTPAQEAAVAITQDDWSAIATLGAGAVEPLKRALASGTPHVRRLAAESLSKIDSERAIAVLLEHLDADDAAIQLACATELEKNAWPRMSPADQARVAVMLRNWPAAISAGEGAVKPLRQAFKNVETADRVRIIDAWRRIGGGAASDALLAAARDGDTEVRAHAIGALAGLANATAIDALVDALSDSDMLIRSAAAEGLRQIEWQPAEPVLQASLAIAEGDAATLTKLGDVAIELLEEDLRVPELRARTVELLNACDANFVNRLTRMLDDAAAEMRACAIEALALVGDTRATKRFEAMLGDADEATRNAAVAALAKLNWQPPSVELAVAAAVASDDWDAVRALGVDAVAPLLDCLDQKQSIDAVLRVLDRIIQDAGADILTTIQLTGLLAMTERFARPTGTRRLVGGPVLQRTVVCRRIAQSVSRVLQSRSKEAPSSGG